MQQIPAQWTTSTIKQYEQQSGQALLRDEQTLVSFSQDFGKLVESSPSAVFIPQHVKDVQSIISFAAQQQLPVTIRGNGLSQCGQSLPIPGGITLSMQLMNKAITLEKDSVWVEANASWVDLLQLSLKEHKTPYVVPANCNLSVGGVLSAGGVGTSSFKYGAINAYVKALEVVDGLGKIHVVDKSSALFHACLSGQGRFGVITKAQIKLKPVKSQVKTFYLVYTDQKQWFMDIQKAKACADYMELLCSPSIQGTKIKANRRLPMAQWLYGLHFSVEFEGKAPELKEVAANLKPFNVLNSIEESISSYLLRHNSRFDMMKLLGQWDLFHPWYECYIPTEVLKKELNHILDMVPIHYANSVQMAPVTQDKGGFLMLPEGEAISSFMILNPGVPQPLKESCLEAIRDLDALLIKQGGKRYISGFLGYDLPPNYWAEHFGERFKAWIDLKQQYDPNGVFTSMLHQR